jgi:hypothetical protein
MIDETFWIPSDKKPLGDTRMVFVRYTLGPNSSLPRIEVDLAKWFSAEGCFSLDFYCVNANDVVTHWAEIPSYE